MYRPGLDDPLVIYDPGGGFNQLHYFLTDGDGRLLSDTDSSGNDKRSSYNNVFADRARPRPASRGKANRVILVVNLLS